MKELNEWAIYTLTVVVLAVLVFVEGVKSFELQSQISITGADLIKKISHPQIKWQIVDVRELTGDESYDDAHIPGAIPFTGCEFDGALESVKKVLSPVNPTIIVSKNGDKAIYKKCREFFNNARNLAGGFEAWTDASYPEDSGEYTPPRATSGGGCL